MGSVHGRTKCLAENVLEEMSMNRMPRDTRHAGAWFRVSCLRQRNHQSATPGVNAHEINRARTGMAVLAMLVRPPGIEPGYAASETTILSVELRALDSGRCFAWALEGGKSFSGRCRCVEVSLLRSPRTRHRRNLLRIRHPRCCCHSHRIHNRRLSRESGDEWRCARAESWVWQVRPSRRGPPPSPRASDRKRECPLARPAG